MAVQDRNIPAEVKRTLRKEAGFGCCVCGYPFFQYHHIVKYAERPEHVPGDMMVLCPNHHNLVTAGAMKEGEQRSHKGRPHNIVNAQVGGPIRILEGEKKVSVGGNNFRNNGALLVVNAEPLITTTYSPEGILLLSISLYDENNNLIAKMDENEWETDPSVHWDLEAHPQELIIKGGTRRIQLKVRAKSAESVEIIGQLWKDGQSIQLEPNGMRIDGVVKNARFSDCSFENTSIRIDTRAGTLSI